MKYLLLSATGAWALLFGLKLLHNNPSPAPVPAQSSGTHTQAQGLTTACTPTTAVPAKGVIGISDPYLTDPKVAALAGDLKVPWVRAEFAWSEIEKPDGTYDFSKQDAMVASLRGAHIRILADINYIPKNLTDWNVIGAHYEKFLTALVKRYQGQISYWEVFNEPNLPGYGWLTTGVDAKAYGNQYIGALALTNTVVRSIDPGAVIVLGGLSAQGVSATDYLKGIYLAGGKDCFDVVAFHPYGYQNKFKDALALMQGTLDAVGDSGKPIWLDEYGTTDEVNRAAILANAFKDAKQADGFFWFSLKDFSQRPDKMYGLVGYDYSPKPAYAEFKQLLAQ